MKNLGYTSVGQISFFEHPFLQRSSHSIGAPLAKGGWSLSWGQPPPMAPRNSLSSIFRPPTLLLTDYQLWESLIPTKTWEEYQGSCEGGPWLHSDSDPGGSSGHTEICRESSAQGHGRALWTGSQADAGYFTSVRWRERRVESGDKEERRVRMLPRKINLKTSTIRPKEQTEKLKF